jgi:hypothetical protein
MVNFGLNFGDVNVTANINLTILNTSTQIAQKCTSGNEQITVVENLEIVTIPPDCESITLVGATQNKNNKCVLDAATKAINTTITKQMGTVKKGTNLSLSVGDANVNINASYANEKLNSQINQLCQNQNTSGSVFKNLKLVSTGMVENRGRDVACKTFTVLSTSSSVMGNCALQAYQDMVNSNTVLQTGNQTIGTGLGTFLTCGVIVIVVGVLAGVLFHYINMVKTHNTMDECRRMAEANHGKLPAACGRFVQSQGSMPGGSGMAAAQQALAAAAARRRAAVRAATKAPPSATTRHTAARPPAKLPVVPHVAPARRPAPPRPSAPPAVHAQRRT